MLSTIVVSGTEGGIGMYPLLMRGGEMYVCVCTSMNMTCQDILPFVIILLDLGDIMYNKRRQMPKRKCHMLLICLYAEFQNQGVNA